VGESECFLRAYNLFGDDGLELSIELEGEGPLRIELEERSYGLPEVPGDPLMPRPADTMAKPFRYSDLVKVKRTYDL
jgi:hypothetical protein